MRVKLFLAGVTVQAHRLQCAYQPSIIDRTPESTADRQYGWPNQTRRFACSARGLPHPAVTWMRNSQPVANNEFYHVTTTTINGKSDEDVTTSVLEVSIGAKQHWLYGSYTCIAKNSWGQTKKVFHLQEAEPPEAPGNVTVVDETDTSVTLHVGEQPLFETSAAVTSSRPTVTSWRIEYKQVSINDTQDEWRSVVFDNEGKPTLTVVSLSPDTLYTFNLSAGNAVGYSPIVKFRVQTHKAVAKEKSDGPARGRARAAGDDAEALLGYSGALEKHNAASVVGNEDEGSSRAGLYAGVVIGVMAALAVCVALAVGAVIKLRRRPNVDATWWHADLLCCNSDNVRTKDNLSKTLKTPSTSVVRRTGVRRLNRLMFWKRRSNPTPMTDQQAGAGWPANGDMGRPSHAASDPNAHMQATPTAANQLAGLSDAVNDSSSSAAAAGIPERSRVHSPLMSPRQHQPHRAPGTPPRTVYRSPSAASSCTGCTTPQMSSPQAWKCLKSPPLGSSGETPVASGAAGSISGPTHLLSASSTDNFPEREWQLKKFLESPQDSTGVRQSFGSEDDRSYNDILDGYHSEDNIDDNEDNNDNYTVAVRKL